MDLNADLLFASCTSGKVPGRPVVDEGQMISDEASFTSSTTSAFSPAKKRKKGNFANMEFFVELLKDRDNAFVEKIASLCYNKVSGRKSPVSFIMKRLKEIETVKNNWNISEDTKIRILAKLQKEIDMLLRKLDEEEEDK